MHRSVKTQACYHGPGRVAVETTIHMKRKRICFPFVGDDVGGSHISVVGLLRRLDRARFDPLVLVQHPGGAVARLMRDAGIPVEAAPQTPNRPHGQRLRVGEMPGMARAVLPLRAALSSRGIDIVHTNDGRTHATWALPAKLAGCRLVWHHRAGPDALGLRFAAPLLADAILSVSRFACGERMAEHPRHRVVHSPFDTELVADRGANRARLLAELGCDPATAFLGYFGALIARKRALLFVETIAALRAADPARPIMGVIFGEEFDVTARDIARHARSLGCADAIRYMGFRDRAAEWMSACDLLLVPAIDEPFGRTLIEAMLVGTPVVATRSGGNEEALRGGRLGTLVPPEDAAALAAGAAALLGNKAKWQQFADLAQHDARTRFGEDRHAAAVMATYDRVMSRAPSSARAFPDGALLSSRPDRPA